MKYAEILQSVLEGKWVKHTMTDKNPWIKMNDKGIFEDDEGKTYILRREEYSFNCWEVKPENPAEEAIMKFEIAANTALGILGSFYTRTSMIGMFNAGRELGQKESEPAKISGEIYVWGHTTKDGSFISLEPGVAVCLSGKEIFPYTKHKYRLVPVNEQNEYRDVKTEKWKPLRTKSTNSEYHLEMTPEEFVKTYRAENVNKGDGYTFENMVAVVRLAMSIT